MHDDPPIVEIDLADRPIDHRDQPLPPVVVDDEDVVTVRRENFRDSAKRVTRIVEDFEAHELVAVELPSRQAGELSLANREAAPLKRADCFRSVQALQGHQPDATVWASVLDSKPTCRRFTVEEKDLGDFAQHRRTRIERPQARRPANAVRAGELADGDETLAVGTEDDSRRQRAARAGRRGSHGCFRVDAGSRGGDPVSSIRTTAPINPSDGPFRRCRERSVGSFSPPPH
jgi:hypothetical protein